MMTLKIKKIFTTAVAVGCIAIMTCVPAMAANYTSYAGTVKKLTDLETSLIMKSTTGSAYNEVKTLEDGCTLVCWMEDSSETRVSEKVSYSTTGTKTIDYSQASAVKGNYILTNISTAASQLSSVYTAGRATPN